MSGTDRLVTGFADPALDRHIRNRHCARSMCSIFVLVPGCVRRWHIEDNVNMMTGYGPASSGLRATGRLNGASCAVFPRVSMYLRVPFAANYTRHVGRNILQHLPDTLYVVEYLSIDGIIILCKARPA